MEPTSTDRRSRYRGCLLAGAIGDALGAPVEFWSLARIRAELGPEGVTGYLPYAGGLGHVTDDTQMTLFTAEGLLEARERGADRREAVHAAYLRWLVTQGCGSRHPAFDPAPRGGLVELPALHAQRAPGNTCLSALMGPEAGTIERALNHSKGCGGVMRAAPAGLAGVDDPFRVGCEIAALTHGHPSGWLAAGVLARLVRDLADGQALEDALEAAVAALKTWPDHGEVLSALDRARALARSAPVAPETVEQVGAGWIGEEALAVGVYCALVAPDLPAGLRLAVTHSGDADSTGSIAGNLLGAMAGEGALPPEWLAPLELRDELVRMADALLATR
jgi:ADP-ribosylglycohydrolase